MNVFLKFLFIVVGIAGLALILAIPTMLAWNWSMPSIFQLPEIGLLQAWSLNLLGGAFFKSGSSAVQK